MNRLLPRVDFVPLSEGAICSVPDVIGVTLDGLEDWCLTAFAGRCKQPVVHGDWMSLRREPALRDEAYRLTISEDRVCITAGGERGAIWGLVTMAQLLRENTELPTGTLEDCPRYSHRGLLLDCSRHFFDAEEVKRVIELMSIAKMNVLHWHLSDDQGWRIESKRFPRLHETSRLYYMQNEIKKVVDYARLRGVEIIPEIDMPGHTLGILAAYPDLSCSGEAAHLVKSGGIYRKILCVGKEETYAFLDALLEELCNLFPSNRFHIGGDEAPKAAWKECPHCRSLMRKKGFSDWEDLQGEFSCRVNELLKKHGKSPILWNDSLRANRFPEEAIAQYWSVAYNGETADYVRRGGAWLESDMFELYFDYPYAMTPLKKVYECKPDFGSEGTPAKEPIGIEACVWAEHIHTKEQLEALLFPRLYAVAELSWSGSGDYDSFEQRLSLFCEKLGHLADSFTPRACWNPEGAVRQREAFAYLRSLHEVGLRESEEKVDPRPEGADFGRKFMSRFFRPEDIPILTGNAGGKEHEALS